MDFIFIFMFAIAGAALVASVMMAVIGGRYYRQMSVSLRVIGIFMIGAIATFWFLTGGQQSMSALPGEWPPTGGISLDEQYPIAEQYTSAQCEKTGSYAYIEYMSRSPECEGLEQRGNEWVTWCDCP